MSPIKINYMTINSDFEVVSTLVQKIVLKNSPLIQELAKIVIEYFASLDNFYGEESWQSLWTVVPRAPDISCAVKRVWNDYIKKTDHIMTYGKMKDVSSLTYMPLTINSEKYTLRTLSAFVRTKFPTFTFAIDPQIMDEIGDIPVDQPYWVMMRSYVMPMPITGNKKISDREATVSIVAEISKFKSTYPTPLEAATSIIMQYIFANHLPCDLNMKLISKEPNYVVSLTYKGYLPLYLKDVDIIGELIEIPVWRYS